jgi:hypothetical protein
VSSKRKESGLASYVREIIGAICTEADIGENARNESHNVLGRNVCDRLVTELNSICSSVLLPHSMISQHHAVGH